MALFIGQVYVPIIFSLILFFFAIRYDFNSTHRGTINLFGIEIEITDRRIWRIVCCTISLWIVPYLCNLNYAKFFPEDLQMEVFYDSAGIKKSLSEFTNDELLTFNYNKSNDQYAEIYYKDLDKKLNDLLNYNGFFSLSDGIVHSKGETKFMVSKETGFQNYYIEKAKGELNHILERPNYKSIEFHSFFEKLPSQNDYIRPSISDILVKHEIILKPLFKQVVAEKYKSNGIIFDHTLMGVTKVKLLPFPKFYNTVYFFAYKKNVSVPIGYAVYR